MSPSLWAGLDVGGSKIDVLIVDEQEHVRGRALLATDTASPTTLLNSMNDGLLAALQQTGATLTQLEAIGVGIPGQIDSASGIVRHAVNLNLNTFNLGEALSARWQRPLYLENDVRVATLGAYHFINKNTPLQHLAYVSIGTGIAAGLILNGRLYRGATGMAGEIGHIIAVPNGEPCACGLHGCLETVAAGPAIARAGTAILTTNGAGSVTTKTVYDAAQNGNSAAQTIINQVSYHLAQAFHALLMSYDVEKIVLGGGVTRAGAAFLDPVLSAISQLGAQSELAQLVLDSNKFTLLPSDYNAGSWGALMLAQNNGR